MSRPRQRGFSTLELLIVVAIIGLVATIAVPRMMCEVRKAGRVAAEVLALAGRDAIEMFRVEQGRLPASLAEAYHPLDPPPGLDYSLVPPAPPKASGSLRRSPAASSTAPARGAAGGYLLTAGHNLCPGCGVNVDRISIRGFAEGFGPVTRVSMPSPAAGNPSGGGGGAGGSGPTVICPGDPKCPEAP